MTSDKQKAKCRSNMGNVVNEQPPAAPTSAAPGSPKKIAVLELRARAGEQLFHPGDLLLGDPE